MARTRTPLPSPLRRLIKLLAFFFILHFFVLPQIAGVHKSLNLLAQVHVGLLVVAVLLEAASVLAYTRLTHSVLPRGRSPGLFTLLRVQLSTLAISHVVPGGSAAGGALGYRLLTQQGLSGTDTAFALATQALGSAVVLNVILWSALVISIPLGHHLSPLYSAAALLGALLIAAFAALVVLLMRGEQRAVTIMRAIARRLPFLDPDQVERVVRRLAGRLQTLIADRRLLLRAFVWASANWLLDAGSLYVFVAAFGHRVPFYGVLVAFGLANVLAVIPVTPAGLGIVEGVLIPSLVGFGAPRGVATLAVIAYRLVNFWLPIPLGGLSYLSLEVQTGQAASRRQEELRKLAEQSLAAAEDRRSWAKRHGMHVPPPPQPDDPGTH